MTLLRFILTILCCLVMLNASSQAQSLIVIANAQGAATSMSSTELRAIFKGQKQRWENGNRVVVAIVKGNTAIGGQILTKVFGVSFDDFQKIWLTLVFQGKAPAPKYFDTENDLKNFIKSTPGAIGIMNSTAVDEGTTQIAIDGKKVI